jgi:DNA-binding NarL/FixJ family response regulator
VACLAVLPDVTSVGRARSVAEALDQIDLYAADVAIVDPGMLDGLSFMRRLSRESARAGRVPPARRRGALLAAIDAGATGFLERHTDPDRLAASVRAAARGAA